MIQLYCTFWPAYRKDEYAHVIYPVISLVIPGCLLHAQQWRSAKRESRRPDDITRRNPRQWNELYDLQTDFLHLTVKYDTALHRISKAQFLQSFATGNYLPLRIISDDTTISYTLYPLPDTANRDVRSAVKYYGEVYNNYYKREGELFPTVNFTDVYGTAYNNESFKGKTVVLKFWFIHCGACVAEMPRLNVLVKEYINHKEVLFLSLAYDTKEQLINFLKKTAFRYATIPVSESFVLEDMKINAFPTHMILKDGAITKISNDAEELAAALHESVPVK